MPWLLQVNSDVTIGEIQLMVLEGFSRAVRPPEVRKHSSHIVQFIPAVCDPGLPIPSSHARIEQAILPIEGCRHDSGLPLYILPHSSEVGASSRYG